MNYSNAVKGALTRSGAVREIISQSELEFGRPFSPEEEVKLFAKFSPQFILNRIQKVSLKESLKSRINHLFSMVLVLSSSSSF